MLKRSLVNVAFTLALAVSWPLMAAAADHTRMIEKTPVPHKKTSSLDAQTVDGIKASAQLNDVQAAMAKAGKEETHHLLVFFTDQAGAAIKTDAVAVKVTSPDGIEGQSLLLHGMGHHYGVDLKLAQPGTYHFAVETKFSDGKKRQFVFSAAIK